MTAVESLWATDSLHHSGASPNKIRRTFAKGWMICLTVNDKPSATIDDRTKVMIATLAIAARVSVMVCGKLTAENAALVGSRRPRALRNLCPVCWYDWESCTWGMRACKGPESRAGSNP